MLNQPRRNIILSSKDLWIWLRGPRDKFALEERMLNASGVLSAGTLLIFTFYNLFVVLLPELVIATLITLAVQLYLYYESRFRSNFKIAKYGFTYSSYVFLIVNFYYGSGINGPVLFSFFLTLIIIIAIHKRRRYLFLFLHWAVVAALLTYDYHYWAIDYYTSKAERFLDVATILCIMLTLTYLLVQGILRSYIYERKQAAERAEALALLHQENNRLFSIISHDLRTPLSSIQGYLELLNNKMLDEADKAMLEGQLLQLTNGTSEFLTNLLLWSKSQLEGTKVRLEQVDFSSLLAQVLPTISIQADKKEVHIQQELAAASFVADIEMTKIVLRNLLSNAIKYSHRGGKVLLQTWVDANRLILAVKDFGVGISPEKQAAIFSAKITSIPGTNNEPGVGLGLVLCADFVALQQGKIWFESEVGEGTTFFVSFPLDGSDGGNASSLS